MIELVPERAAPRFLGHRRVLVLGCCGAGKSTLCRALGPLLGLPVVHLDVEYWRPGWTAPPAESWERRARELAAAEAWLMDGDFSGTLPLRLERAEAVVHLDLPRLTCVRRILARALRGGSRPDLPAGCREELDAAFLAWTWRHVERSRPAVLARLAEFARTAPVARLRDEAQVARFTAVIAALAGGLSAG